MKKKYDNIHEALLAAISSMPESLEKDGKITIGRGKDRREIPYTSIDMFYQQTREHFLSHGIIPWMTQTDVTEKHFDPLDGIDEQGNKITVRSPSKYMIHYKLWFEYFGEKSSEIDHSHLLSLHPSRSVEQTFGAGRSYTWKYVIRNFCMLATGDPDADDLAVEEAPSTTVTKDLNEADKLNGSRNRALSAYHEVFAENAQGVASWILSNVVDATGKEFAHYTETHLGYLWGWLGMVDGHDIRDSVLNAVRTGIPVKDWGNSFRAAQAQRDSQIVPEPTGVPLTPPTEANPATPAPTAAGGDPAAGELPVVAGGITAFGDKHLKGSEPEAAQPEIDTTPKPQTIPDRKAAVAKWLTVHGFSGRHKQRQLIRWVLGHDNSTLSTMKHEDLAKFELFMEVTSIIGEPEDVNSEINKSMANGETHKSYLESKSGEVDQMNA